MQLVHIKHQCTNTTYASVTNCAVECVGAGAIRLGFAAFYILSSVSQRYIVGSICPQTPSTRKADFASFFVSCIEAKKKNAYNFGWDVLWIWQAVQIVRRVIVPQEKNIIEGNRIIIIARRERKNDAINFLAMAYAMAPREIREQKQCDTDS